MKKIKTFDSEITIEDYGGKAYWINWMKSQGIHVPDSLFIPVMCSDDVSSQEKKRSFLEKLKEHVNLIFGNGVNYAVRSSSRSEDGRTESNAGRFSTFLNVGNSDEIAADIFRMVEGVERDSGLGVIIQEMVSASYSGVIFSSDPWRGKKSDIYMSVVRGFGDQLVAGFEAGEDIKAQYVNGQVIIGQYRSDLARSILLDLCNVAKWIESKLKFPVDIEWCVEKDTNQIFILQCRPVTTVFAAGNTVVSVESHFVDRISPFLLEKSIISLKTSATKYGVCMPDAFFLFCNCRSDEAPVLPQDLERSGHYKGYSIVLISPDIENMEDHFLIGDKTKVYSSVKCHRFGVRDVADYSNLNACVVDLYKFIKPRQWACSFLIQEIWEAKYSGIIQKTQEGYMIEISKGVFPTKGLSSMSTYIVGNDGLIKYRREIRQQKYMDVAEGCVLEHYDLDNEIVSFSDEYINSLREYFAEVMDDVKGTLEFGILDDAQMTPYLMGCAEWEDKTDLSLQTVERGIISAGKIAGKLVKLNLQEECIQVDVNPDIPIIFFTDTPKIQLRKILDLYNSSQIGFVFSEGSLLCHFAILLRERGIPAVRGIAGSLLTEGDRYIIDTSSEFVLEKMVF